MIDLNFINKCENELKDCFAYLDDIALYNQNKVLSSFKSNKVALRHFNGTSGYGYDDEGRDTLNKVFSDIFKAESAICSPNIVSGTHALSLCLFALTFPGDLILSITGEPYDTLLDVITGKGVGSLEDYNVRFDAIPLKNDLIDVESVLNRLKQETPKVIYLQRSRGYAWRKALSIAEIESVVKAIRNAGYNGCIMLDNCYGEFLEKREATEVGVNIMAGSMIKNPGGGVAPTGGYVVGDKKYVNLVQNRLTSPSIGAEVGSYYNGYQYFYQGLFLAPHVVMQAVKGVMLYSLVFTKLGYEVSPKPFEYPDDIITAIKFNDEEKLIKFIQTVQKNSPIDSFVDAMPWEMPGYKDKVIMAAGCFVQGSSIEISADAPIKPPYIAYFQGGLTYEHCKIVLSNIDL